MIVIFVFLFGISIGSFLNVLIYREAEEKKLKASTRFKKLKGLEKYLPLWMIGRSFCVHCQKELKWYDNIPLLSYFILRGKCRYCHKKIPLQYPILELLVGIQFVWVYFLIKGNFIFFNRFEGFYSLLVLIFWLFFGAICLMIVVSDFKYQVIPDSSIVFGIILILTKKYLDYWYTGHIVWNFIPAGLLAAGFFTGIYLLTKGKGMGFGDVKLALLLGLLLGLPLIIVAVFIAFLTGGLVAGILLLLGKKKFKQAIAFGPFLVFGATIALFWGQEIIKWYLSFY